MKLLLAACNAKYIHSNLAVYNLRAYAAEYKDRILLREYTINQQKDEILKDIYQSGADVICFSCYIWNIGYVRALAQDLKKVLPDADLWAGGPEVSFDAEKFLSENEAFTGVMVGEGENTFRELAGFYLEKKSELSEIHGMVFREGNRIIATEQRALTNLDEIPFVYHDMKEFENKIIYYESSRGCPFSCSYCLSSVDKKLRFRSLALVKKELQFFLDQKVPQVKFVDRTFNCRHEHAMEIWKYLLEHDNGVTNFHFEISADLLKEEEMDLMRNMRPGLIQLEIGVQSTNPRTIDAIHRHMDLVRLKKNVSIVYQFRNIHQHLDLIAGLPYENYDSFSRSFDDVYVMKPDQLQLGFLKVLKGSLMEQEAEGYGIVCKSEAPYEVLKTNWLPYGDVLRLKMLESMVEVYYNSGQFGNTLNYLINFFERPFVFFERLGEFYEEKGYGELSHSRMQRYEILLEFVRERTEISAEETADYMVMDLYLRERLKKRPEFAGDQKPYEKKIWEYRREHKIPRSAHVEVFADGRAVLFDYERRDPLSHNAFFAEVEL